MTSPTNAVTPAAPQDDLLGVTIDGVETRVPKGTLIIRAAEQLGIAIPRFCDHPLLAPAANCRMCLIEIEGQPKPQPACAVTCADGMSVRTARTSELAHSSQWGAIEFLLVNHPLDCPVCDKGGECPLQNQTMSHGSAEGRFYGPKRTFPKPVNVSAQILLDRERCISCARCTRFADEIAGDPFIALTERGANQQIATGPDDPFDSYFSGNTVQICPVGALTSSSYRFRSRPFDLVSTPTVCEHCAAGCAMRTDVRRGVVLRRLAGDDPQVNEEWNCDKGRFAFPYLAEGRLTHPLVRDEHGTLVPASWPEALDVAARGLAAAGSRVGVLPGGRLTYENAYAYAKFARAVLGTDNLDFRARAVSPEETQFLAALVAGRPVGPTYADLERAPVVLLVGFEPEDESPIVFLRLRKASGRDTRVFSVAPYASVGLRKMHGTLLASVPGDEPGVLERLGGDGGSPDEAAAAALLRTEGAVVLVGERLAQVPGALSAAARLADVTGARLGWVPRRAGERGALDAGALAGLLPGGRPLADPSARAQVAAAWGIDAGTLPEHAGLDLPGMVAAITADTAALAAASDPGEVTRQLDALLVAGVEPADLPDRAAFLTALAAVPFVVSLEQRHSEVTERADVVFPVAVVTEQAGSFLNWEGRRLPFPRVMAEARELTDARVLALLAEELDAKFGRGDVATLAAELVALGRWDAERAGAPSVAAGQAPVPGAGEAVLSGWRQLLDSGVLQEGEPFMAATARQPVVRLSPARASGLGVGDGDPVTVSTERGALTLPAALTPMPDQVVWLPLSSPDSHVYEALGVEAGAVVRVTGGPR